MFDTEFWRLPTVIQRVGLSKSEIYSRIQAGTFPAPRRYPDSQKSFWLSSEVIEWQQGVLTSV